MIPTQPVLSLSVLSSTSLQGNVTGADAGATVQSFYELVGTPIVNTGPSIVGNGNFTITGLQLNSGYIVYVFAFNGASYSLPSFGTISLATTDSLKGALVAALGTNAGFASICPNTWADEIPATDQFGNEIVLPFCVVSVTSEEPQWNTEYTAVSSNYYSICQCRIEIFAVGADAADQIRLAAESVLNWQPLPFATATTIQVMETKISSNAEWQLAKTGQKAFNEIVEYEIWITRP